MFGFVIKHFGFLKYVPLAPHVFDAMLKVWTAFSRPHVLGYIDTIEAELMRWQGMRLTIHKYGGIQFNYHGKELGHIHSNGLLDMPLSRKQKHQLMQQHATVQDHHTFKGTGWISLFIKAEGDVQLTMSIFQLAYKTRKAKMSPTNSHYTVPIFV
ncbi:hypothetical protein FPZ43_04930 [Mucilaginibacter pallidiroseus]|uniref:Luciferase domain-containing protein n=1 Tax=Mucilaginibacter pallidiroseus TaxID=2599295 RepID=A0A563UFZ3_9SPHI|nr:luciferase family protein [Mucilaginibacter pallidiroseus]TWR30285.1 hypothetical protein FPZ43_04930 [Mucilaginibacter pallidiroseus]